MKEKFDKILKVLGIIFMLLVFNAVMYKTLGNAYVFIFTIALIAAPSILIYKLICNGISKRDYDN